MLEHATIPLARLGQPSGLTQLPAHLTERIFSHLDAVDLLAVGQTCAALRDPARDGALWERLDAPTKHLHPTVLPTLDAVPRVPSHIPAWSPRAHACLGVQIAICIGLGVGTTVGTAVSWTLAHRKKATCEERYCSSLGLTPEQCADTLVYGCDQSSLEAVGLTLPIIGGIAFLFSLGVIGEITRCCAAHRANKRPSVPRAVVEPPMPEACQVVRRQRLRGALVDALHEACDKGFLPKVEFLCKQPVDLEVKRGNLLPVQRARCRFHDDILLRLVQAGHAISPDLLQQLAVEGSSVFPQVWKQAARENISAYLLRAQPADLVQLVEAKRYRETETILHDMPALQAGHLICGTGLTSQSHAATTPLLEAALARDVEMFCMLLRFGGDVDSGTEEVSVRTVVDRSPPLRTALQDHLAEHIVAIGDEPT